MTPTNFSLCHFAMSCVHDFEKLTKQCVISKSTFWNKRQKVLRKK